MNVLTQNVLDELISNLKTIKYRNIIQDLKLEYCVDNRGDYIYLVLINIKKSKRESGYGSIVLNEVIKIADEYNVRIRLWATDGYGSEIKRLYRFYRRHGFIAVKNNISGHMQYYPDKLVKIKKN